ncbi:leucine-rich repeat and WD repeat-containing protein 1 isoform X2 [Lingula anatina]|uniref:Leucine-rich repeat and WD repeat-containing protein 1 isoform X1 n=1 Tax=Lingula anatina TaxID=7574 RepID=A0A1S3H1G5_LINAN|nr:leucine-rich repeat and WD repeat-containing protein 1 isoform X1 [Lingula anatina]XP_013379782.1 leucine-rich repeat and WD repeat-containing protein 1 isoform X2 [Lingula anatina]|eukprot:XP_013379781.1 leucine-rich repeat and WD repeat-containing protein 1 isoform X1 [Lingula anatina]
MNDLRKQKLIEGKDLYKYKEFMLESVAQELMHSVQGNSHAGVSPRKRRRIEETEDEENYENTNHFSKIQPKPCILNLPDVPDYDPVHFVRCHAKDNNPSDNRTKVWKCAFEPELDNPGETTNIVATCGGDILCLLDCSTGKLMMRYKLPKEHFFTVAWTTVCSSTSSGRGSKRTNILATGGKLGIVHLIHPAQHLCYAELKGHTKYISSLLVHPEEPTWLFSGGADAKVILWDIGVPSFPDYKTSHKQLLVLQSPGGDVLNTVFLSNYLIAGCEKNCYGWHIDKSNLDKRMSRQPTLEINIPKPQNDIVDALVQVSNDIIATKCSQQGFIQLWRFSDVLAHAQNRKCVTAMPIARLKWKNVDTPYINLGAVLNAGLVYCGDDEGQLWIYNVKPVITKKIKKSTSYELMSPSRILPWPECCIPTEREQEKLMGDVLDKGEPIVINSATGSWNHEYIVAGTDNNLVCIWKKI